MIVFISPRFLKYATFNFAKAIALWPFIILSSPKLKDDKRLMIHERIHLKQQLELLIIGFYIFYLLEYFVRRIKYNHYNAYIRISFEKEAYANEHDSNYLKKRSIFSFRFFNYL